MRCSWELNKLCFLNSSKKHTLVVLKLQTMVSNKKQKIMAEVKKTKGVIAILPGEEMSLGLIRQ